MHFETKTTKEYHRIFVLTYFWKIRKTEFTLQCNHFFFVVKQRKLFDKLEKTKELLFTECVYVYIYIYQARNQEFFRAGEISENKGTSINI